ncbi:hypothetical protein [Gynuella sunshinyii]|uniref:GLUG domain-containing protein n=1 Tax=Gynuella sunshinyii YC6258 TaxID=1445510 RepID=A0A0C5VQ04_9GAMM|nr:hypothetical protein [Gynuella sunshinyii]AJQ96687.1 hypothetical Protein YC6258_04655 [Gynuella sunshinyii YC6258]
MKSVLTRKLINQSSKNFVLLAATLIAPLTHAVNPEDVDVDNNGLIEISTIEELNQIRYNLIGSSYIDIDGNSLDAGCPVSGCIGYELVKDLDFDPDGSGLWSDKNPFWNDGKGWEPVGSKLDPFAAHFNGNGHTINKLYIDRTDNDFVGLFGVVSSQPDQDVKISDLVLREALIYGNNYVGGIVGSIDHAYEGRQVVLSDSRVNGVISGEKYVGGLVGYVNAENCAIVKLHGNTSNIMVVGADNTGGLVGYVGLDTGFSDSDSTYVSLLGNSINGQVAGRSKVGGLVGYLLTSNGGSIDFSVYARVDSNRTEVTVTGESKVGGLIGSAIGSGDNTGLYIANSESNSMVIATKDYVGGLIGELDSDGYAYVRATRLSAKGYASGKNAVGGLIGSATASYSVMEIYDSYAWTDVRGIQEVGGLIGFVEMGGSEVYLDIYRTYSIGRVKGQESVGGLVGDFSDGNGFFKKTIRVESSYWDITTSGIKVSATGYGYSSADLKCRTRNSDDGCNPSIYKGWDSDIWDFGSENDYPTLK